MGVIGFRRLAFDRNCHDLGGGDITSKIVLPIFQQASASMAEMVACSEPVCPTIGFVIVTIKS